MQAEPIQIARNMLSKLHMGISVVQQAPSLSKKRVRTPTSREWLHR